MTEQTTEQASEQTSERATDPVCCPRFDPTGWDDTEITWTDRRFVKDRVRSVLGMPLNFPSVMKRNVARIEAAGAKPEHMIVLADQCSMWGTDVYIDVTRDVPDSEMASISGTFISKVFEGPYRDFGKWMKAMRELLKSRGRSFRKIYCYYTTCPGCAKTYGKNYVVLLAELS